MQYSVGATTQHDGRTRDDHRAADKVWCSDCRRAGMRPIYLDYNASTPIDPAVAAAMRPFLEEPFGNPSSGHWASAPAKAALETAPAARSPRCSAAAPTRSSSPAAAARPTISRSRARSSRCATRGDHIITTAIEHPAFSLRAGFSNGSARAVTYLPVDRTGRVDPDDLRRAITPRTILVSIMHANNEVGTIQPIEEIGAHRPRAWRPLSHRRRAVGRQDSDRGQRARRRSAVDRRSQALCPQGRRRAVSSAAVSSSSR